MSINTRTIPELHQMFLESDGISTDSRTVQPGQLFFALKGDHFDANAFAVEALERGAMVTIVTDPEFAKHPRFGDQVIIVENALKTLQELATYHRRQFNIPIIGITGTNGKTTTKELVAAVLIEKYRIVKTEGNLNNHIGVPLTLLRIRQTTQIAIIEMGANHLTDIRDLCAIAEPTHGVITNIGLAHLEGFGSKEGVAKAKGELYVWLRDHAGTIFVNMHDGDLTSLLYHLDPGCKAETVRYGDEHVPENPLLFGDYNKENMKTAMAIGHHFKITMVTIVMVLKRYVPNNMRGQKLVTKRENEIILDAYNANPSSMKAALESFSHFKSDKPKWIILGDMKELGEATEKSHQDLINDITFYCFSNVILIGEELCKAHGEMKRYACFKTKEDFLNSAFASSIKNSIVLIKGSNGMKMWEIADRL